MMLGKECPVSVMDVASISGTVTNKYFTSRPDQFLNLGQDLGKTYISFSSSWRQVYPGGIMVVVVVRIPPKRPQLCHPLLLGVINKNKKSCSHLLKGCGAQLVLRLKQQGIFFCQLWTLISHYFDLAIWMVV